MIGKPTRQPRPQLMSSPLMARSDGLSRVRLIDSVRSKLNLSHDGFLLLAASVAKIVEEKYAQVRKQIPVCFSTFVLDIPNTNDRTGYSAYQTLRCPRGYSRVPRVPTGPTRLSPNVYGFFTFRESARFGRRGFTPTPFQSPFVNTSTSHTHTGLRNRQKADMHYPYQSSAEPDEQDVYAASPTFDMPRITFRRNGPVRPSYISRVNGQGKGLPNPLLTQAIHYYLGSKSRKETGHDGRLRDFADDQAIEDALETVESDRPLCSRCISAEATQPKPSTHLANLA